MKIKVYGSSGCKKCSKLKENIEEVIKENKKQNQINVEKIEDLTKLASKGLMSTPAIEIDGEIKVKGSAPSKKELEEIIF
ncbi:thioredoxin family protein [archaeon SCG-AAA382B04]|nr:thioredoxin family protein [archaeon SCG-AAA382B04]